MGLDNRKQWNWCRNHDDRTLGSVSLIYGSMIRLPSLTATAPGVHDLSHGSSSPRGILDFSMFFASENSALSNFWGAKNLRNCQQQHLGKFEKNDGVFGWL